MLSTFQLFFSILLVSLLFTKCSLAACGIFDSWRYNLIDAAVNGEVGKVGCLIDSGVSIYSTNANGETALILASMKGHTDIVKALLDADKTGVSINMISNDGLTALMVASAQGYINIVRSLINHGADVEIKDRFSDTALLATVNANTAKNLACVEALLYSGANVNSKNKAGDTVLIVATKHLNNGLITLLLKYGADVNLSDRRGRTPLCFASTMGNAEISELFLQHGSDVNTVDDFGDTPLTLAISNVKRLAEHSQVVRMLVAAGAEVGVADATGNTPLILAARANVRDICDALLLQPRGLNIDATTKDGETAIYIAAQNNNSNMFDSLLERGADLNLKPKFGDSLLSLIAKSNDTMRVKQLVEKGALVNSNSAKSPLYLSVLNNNTGMFMYLVDKGAVMRHERSCLMLSALYGNVEITRVLLNSGLDINMTDPKGQSPLLLASGVLPIEEPENFVQRFGGSFECVRLLTEQGADVNVVDAEGVTPLAVVAKRGDVRTARLLVSAGAKVSAEICSAAEVKDNTAMVELFLGSGADPNYSCEGHHPSPLHRAVASNEHSTVQVLVDYGADLSMQSTQGETVLDIATGRCRDILEEARSAPMSVLMSHIASGDENSALKYLSHDEVDWRGRTALIWAAMKGHVSVASLLIKLGANLNARDKLGHTALFWAASNGHKDMKQLLTDAGADTTCLD